MSHRFPDRPRQAGAPSPGPPWANGWGLRLPPGRTVTSGPIFRERMIFTVGHSNHILEFFFHLLAGPRITPIADVRSRPHSRWSPQVNSDALTPALVPNN